MTNKEPSIRDIVTAHYDGVRDAQIGGKEDGISPEVAADLGFETPKRVAKIISDMGSVASAVEMPPEAVEMPPELKLQMESLRKPSTPSLSERMDEVRRARELPEL